MQPRRVERDRRAGGTPAEKIHPPALPHQPHRRLPHRRFSNRLDHHIKLPPGQQLLRHAIDRIVLHRVFRAERARLRQPVLTPAQHLHRTSGLMREGDEHQTDQSRADHQHSLTLSQLALLQALHHAGQRFGQRGIAKGSSRLETQQIFLHQPRRNDNGLGVRAVEKHQVIAKIFLFVTAIKTPATRRRVRHHHAVAAAPDAHASVTLADDAREFVAEDRRRHDHLRVITALEHLQVRAAGQRGLDANPHLARPQRALGDFFDFDLLFPVEDGGFHGVSGRKTRRSVKPRCRRDTAGARDK